VALVVVLPSIAATPAYKEEYHSGFSPVVGLRKGKGNFAFVVLADQVLASTAVDLGLLRLSDGRTLEIGRPSNFQVPESGTAKSLFPPTHKFVPPSSRRLMARPPPVPQTRSLPLRPKPTLWIGNLPSEGLEKESIEEFLISKALRVHGFNLEHGPPCAHIEVHPSGYAYAEIRTASLARDLLGLLHGAEFLGQAIIANWAYILRKHELDMNDGERTAGIERPDINVEEL